MSPVRFGPRSHLNPPHAQRDFERLFDRSGLLFFIGSKLGDGCPTWQAAWRTVSERERKAHRNSHLPSSSTSGGRSSSSSASLLQNNSAQQDERQSDSGKTNLGGAAPWRSHKSAMIYGASVVLTMPAMLNKLGPAPAAPWVMVNEEQQRCNSAHHVKHIRTSTGTLKSRGRSEGRKAPARAHHVEHVGSSSTCTGAPSCTRTCSIIRQGQRRERSYNGTSE